MPELITKLNKETEIMIDYTKVSDNQHVIELIKKREKIEEQIRKIDEVALVRYELEVLSIPNVAGQSEQLCQCYQPDDTTAMNCKNCNRSRWEHNL